MVTESVSRTHACTQLLTKPNWKNWFSLRHLLVFYCHQAVLSMHTVLGTSVVFSLANERLVFLLPFACFTWIGYLFGTVAFFTWIGYLSGTVRVFHLNRVFVWNRSRFLLESGICLEPFAFFTWIGHLSGTVRVFYLNRVFVWNRHVFYLNRVFFWNRTFFTWIGYLSGTVAFFTLIGYFSGTVRVFYFNRVFFWNLHIHPSHRTKTYHQWGQEDWYGI